MFEDLAETGDRLRGRDDIVAVIVHGAGDSFCSGLDFKSLTGDRGVMQKVFARSADSPANFAQRPAYVWREVDLPVIAAISGNCFGGGLQIALGADLRIAAPDARFSVMEIKWGLVPDMSATQTLCDLVRLDVAKELAFTGRIVDADEALELGLITRIEQDPVAAAEALAAILRERSPDALRSIKRLFNDAWRAGDEEGLSLEAAVQQRLLGRPNQIEAVRANLEKRPPRFQLGRASARAD
jgi:enoyl-CoA hydratase/carnithine racemase